MIRQIAAIVMFVLPVAGGAFVAQRLVAQAPGPARIEASVAGLAVRVAEVEAQALVPRAIGWGNVRAAQTWTSVSEVRGAVVMRHPDLETGRLIAAGVVVLEIDGSDYQLAIAQAEADLAALQAESAQIDAEAANTARVLELEQARLALSESDARRIRELIAQGTAAPTRADEAERATLAARRVVVELQNVLALIPPRRDRNTAQIARTDAALARARRDLDHTRVVTPFDIRVTQAPVERFQYVGVGQVLVAGDGLERVEVPAQVPVEAFRRLIAAATEPRQTMELLQRNASALIGASVAPVVEPGQVWHSRVARVEGALDPRARTAQVVIEVEAPFAEADPAQRLPLVSNLQVEVTLTGQPMAPAVVVPESALHGGAVYLMGAGGLLEVRPVTVAFRQDGLAVIASGLEPGARLVLDDIAPAIPGLPLVAVAP